MLSKALSYRCMEVVQLRRPFCPMLDSSRRLACSPHSTVGQAAGCPATPSQLDSRRR